jgi:hypothetical protein
VNDQPPGPGWWRANDGNWYPPETHPDAAPSPQPNLPATQPPPPAAQGQYIPPAGGPQFSPPGFGQQPSGGYGPPNAGPYGAGPGVPGPQYTPYPGPVPYALSAPRRRRSGGGCFPTLVAVVFLGVAVFIGIGLIGNASETEITAGGDVSPTDVATPSPPAATQEYGLNQPIALDGGTMTAVGFRNNYVPDNQFDRPANGSRYVATEIAVTNTGSEQRSISGFWQFELADSIGRNYDSTFATGLNSLSGSIAPGETRRGWIVFEVPNDANGLRLKFLLGPLGRDGTVFIRL